MFGDLSSGVPWEGTPKKVLKKVCSLHFPSSPHLFIFLTIFQPISSCLTSHLRPSSFNYKKLLHLFTLDSMIVSSDLASVSVSPAIVSEALSLLKHGKGDGSNLSSA